jgi:hypothetical protein
VPEAARRGVLIDVLIDMEVLAQAARERGMHETEDFQRRQALLEARALRNLFVEQEIMATVTAEEVEAEYERQAGQFEPEEEVRARHILVETEAEARELIEALDEDADFVVVQNNVVVNTSLELEFVQQNVEQEVTITEVQEVDDPTLAAEAGVVAAFTGELEVEEDAAPAETVEAADVESPTEGQEELAEEPSEIEEAPAEEAPAEEAAPEEAPAEESPAEEAPAEEAQPEEAPAEEAPPEEAPAEEAPPEEAPAEEAPPEEAPAEEAPPEEAPAEEEEEDCPAAEREAGNC